MTGWWLALYLACSTSIIQWPVDWLVALPSETACEALAGALRGDLLYDGPTVFACVDPRATDDQVPPAPACPWFHSDGPWGDY